MENQIVIESPDGTFRAYISRPAKLTAPAVVILQELFGVNADIRATCDELAAQGFIARRRPGGLGGGRAYASPTQGRRRSGEPGRG
jgi:hypothetical protein